ncbi:MAG: DNA polymerase III subunit epsilon [Steroidobacteraceae bacterium]
MRQIVFDTETTGLDPKQGHRIIEVGAVELIGRRRTGRTFHQYFKPDREVEVGAMAVHGITNEFLSTQPRFGELVDELLEFLSGAELVIHNATFDVAFLDAELQRLKHKRKVHDMCSVYDTLMLARELHPGQRNSLDALCKRYDIDNSNREYHGALLDAQLLLDVYLAMTGGQGTLVLDDADRGISGDAGEMNPSWTRPHGKLAVLGATQAELAAHEAVLLTLDKVSGGKTVWRKFLC